MTFAALGNDGYLRAYYGGPECWGSRLRLWKRALFGCIAKNTQANMLKFRYGSHCLSRVLAPKSPNSRQNTTGFYWLGDGAAACQLPGSVPEAVGDEEIRSSESPLPSAVIGQGV